MAVSSVALVSVPYEQQRPGERFLAPQGVRGDLAGRGRSPATQRAYLGDIEQFVAWAQKRDFAQPGAISKRQLREYLAFMTDRGDARTSIVRRRASLRSYFSWLVERGYLGESPAARLSAPRPSSPLPKIVVREQLESLLDEDWGTDEWATLDRRSARSFTVPDFA